MKTRILFLLILTCNLSQTASGYENFFNIEYGYRRYTLHNGLPDMKIQCLHQDKDGFIWLGMNWGLARFDGFDFSFYQPKEKKLIVRIDKNNSEKLSFRSSRYSYYLTPQDTLYTTKQSDTLYLNKYNSRSLPFPYMIYENKEETCKYLMHCENEQLKEVLRLPELNKIEYRKVFLDNRSDILYIPMSEGVCLYDLNSKQKRFLKGADIESFLWHSTVGMLAFGQNGIYKITNTGFEQLFKHDFDFNLTAMEYPDGSIVFFDYHNLYRYKGGNLEKLAELSMITDMLLDREENLWVATYSGLYNFFQFDFQNYKLKDSDVVMSVLEDNENNIYFATLEGNLICKTETSEQKISFPRYGADIFSFSSGAAKNDNIFYFPTPAGIYIKDGKYFFFAKIPHYPFRKVEVTKQGNILSTATFLGVYECDKSGQPVSFWPDDKFQQPVCHALFDTNGGLIVTGTTGLSKTQGDSIHLFSNSKTKDSYVACTGKNGDVWIGSGSHLNLFRNDSIITVHTFINDVIKSMLLTNENHLLLANMHGLYIFDINTYNSNNKIQLSYYGQNNGLTILDPQMYGLYPGNNGTVWLTASDGVVTFEPSKLIRKTTPPVLIIQDSKISTDNVNWMEAGTEKSFSYKYCNVLFSFIGLKYSAVENVRYSWRLKGFQEEWSKPSRAKEASFNNLPPGDYVFEVYTDAGTDDSRSEIQQVQFSIKPAFWQTVWFPVVLILFLMLLTTGIALYIQRRKNRRLLEQLETEKELNELRIKSIRLRSIPHFNANVLSAIEYYIMNFSKEEANRLLNIYSEFIGRTLREVDKASRTLEEELEYTELYLKLEKLRFVDKFDYKIDISPEINSQIQIPNMVLHTYCENAIKHGFAGSVSNGMIHISVVKKENSVEVCVEDNGIGREAALANKNTRSTKQGLSILNRQIEIYNTFNKQKIAQKVVDLYDENKAIGTCFTITVPNGFIYR